MRKRVQKLQDKIGGESETQEYKPTEDTGEKPVQKEKTRSGPWGLDEEARFVEAVRAHGKDWGKI